MKTTKTNQNVARISFSCDQKLFFKIREHVRILGCKTRSEAITHLLEEGLQNYEKGTR